MGKPIKESVAEIEKCQWLCQYYADNAKEFLAPEKVETDYQVSEIHYQPIGVVLAVMPWNYPFWQVFRFAIPAVMAGNTCVLKHASNVPGCAKAIEEIFIKAGAPEGLFHTLLIGSEMVEEVIANSKIKAVSLTGSTQAGKKVAALAGEYLKKTVLELGGSDAYIILEDADLDEAAKLCVKSRLLNNAQSCIGAKRFIAVESVYDEFRSLVLKEMKGKVMGDPLDEDTDLGPMARLDLRDELHQQVVESIKKGAECLMGGSIPDKAGAFYPPTVLECLKSGMPAYDEELFGPVVSLFKVKNLNEALDIANSSIYGLAGGIFSKDIDKAKEIAIKHFDSGACFINDFAKSDPRLPFGGIKQSGYGRELSPIGIKEFVNIKTICVK
jgi:succinate-semialdehyde dehydrogenase/glutarate-semialdehyde dehydrogenase